MEISHSFAFFKGPEGDQGAPGSPGSTGTDVSVTAK